MNLDNIFDAAKAASRSLAQIDPERRNKILLALADAIDQSNAPLLEANALDLARMDPDNPLYDRLKLTPERLSAIADDMRSVASLPQPVGEVTESRTLPNGLKLNKVRVPFGVIGVVYEARPNVTFDVFSLCFKTANACILKGGRDAGYSNTAAIDLIHTTISRLGIDPACVALLPSTHEATAAMLAAVGKIDVCIPRGGRRLIDFVRDNAKVPVIETGAGVVHCYFDANANLAMGRDIIENAKTRRVSVCNALDTLIIHSSRLADLPALIEPLGRKGVEIFADNQALGALDGKYAATLRPADSHTFDTEWMAMRLGIKTVSDISQAIAHIAAHGSGHSEAIITDNPAAADKFLSEVDASCVYHNAPTSFTDGAQFGLGAEIGISTQKLGPRGPMGLTEITTYKYIIQGNGQTRP